MSTETSRFIITVYPEPLESIPHSPNSLIFSPTYNHISPFRFYNCKCELYISLNTTCKEGEEWGACMIAWWRFNQIQEGAILQQLACIHSRNLPPLIESKYPLLCSQQLSPGFYSEPHESTPNPLDTLVLSVQFIIIIIILHIHISFSRGFFASGFLTIRLHAFLISPVCSQCPTHLIPFDFTTSTIASKDNNIQYGTNNEFHHCVIFSTFMSLPSTEV